MEINMQKTITTLGSSDLSWIEFTERLERFGIGCLVDVRSFPRSRRPCFNQAALKSGLNKRGIGYLHLGDQLGGHVTDQELSYTRRTTMPAFLGGIDRVLKIAERCRPALFCAEGEVLDCHRFFILSRYLAQCHDVEIIHIRRDGSAETHAEAEDRLIQRANRFGDLFFDREENLEIAYMSKLLKMGLKP
jgi:uncharacterized protein (DUF488 family)